MVSSSSLAHVRGLLTPRESIDPKTEVTDVLVLATFHYMAIYHSFFRKLVKMRNFLSVKKICRSYEMMLLAQDMIVVIKTCAV